MDRLGQGWMRYWAGGFWERMAQSRKPVMYSGAWLPTQALPPSALGLGILQCGSLGTPVHHSSPRQPHALPWIPATGSHSTSSSGNFWSELAQLVHWNHLIGCSFSLQLQSLGKRDDWMLVAEPKCVSQQFTCPDILSVPGDCPSEPHSPRPRSGPWQGPTPF